MSSSLASAVAVSMRPQLPQYSQHSSHHCLSSASASNSIPNNPMRESMLSDISATLSTISATGASVPELTSPNHGSGLGGRNGIKAGLFHNGEDLEAQRQQAPLSIEEDLFIYDDIVISKDEAHTKHWRLAGRKPAIPAEAPPSDNTATGKNSRSNSLKGKSFFTFNDFDVCVDEMDWMPATTGAASSIAPLQQCNDPSSPLLKMKSMTTTNTVAATPNTVAHFMAQSRLTAPRADRPLRGFQATPVLGHATRVKCIALSPAETDFASCSNEDASISLNNLGVKMEVGIFTGHQDTIINATFSPDGKYLATTSKDKTMILWDVMTTKNLLIFTHPKVVICCSFGPDSKYLVSGCQDRVCRLWDTKRGKEWLSYTSHEGIIISIAFSPDGNYVCSASADKSLRVWSATTAKTRFHLTGHTGIILSCSYTADGRHIVSNDESLLCVWSAEDGSCKLSLSPADVAGATLLNARGPKLGWTLSSAAPGAFTGYALVACNNRFVYVLDIETGAEVTNVFCKAPVYCLTAGSYEKMACGDSFGNIYILTLK
jgi:WD40 repeat protein